MNSYEELLNEAAASDITVIENADFKSQSHGLIYGDIIGLNKNIQTDTERSCILAEELGHYYTSTGDIIDQTNVQNRKQEHRARMWAYDKLLPLQFSSLHSSMDAIPPMILLSFWRYLRNF